MGEEGGCVKACGFWRYLAVWAALTGGLALGLCVCGQGRLVATVYSPFLLTLGGGALLGLSSISLWGLPLILPLCCVCHSWLHGCDRWWRLLPAAALLMGLLSSLALPLSGLGLPAFQGGVFGDVSPVPSEEELDMACAASAQAWLTCARGGGVLMLLLVAHVLFVCGWSRSWGGVKCYAQRLRACSRELHAASAAQERAASAERGSAGVESGMASGRESV